MIFFLSLRQLLTKHWPALIIAVVIGLIYLSPHLYFAFKLGSNYQGIYLSRSYDEDAYDAIIRQVYDGLPVTDNPYIAEYKGQSIGSLYKYPELIIGSIGKITGLSLSVLAISSKFIFPGLIFLAIYALSYSLSGNLLTALIVGTLVLLGCELAPFDLSSAWHTFLFNSPFKSFLFYNRPINPQVSAIFFFINLWLLAKVWLTPQLKKYSILAGILTGLLSYIYFYFWNFTLILIGVLLLAAILKRDKLLIKNLLLIMGVSLIASLPFLRDMIMALGNNTASIQKNYVLTHRFVAEKVILVPLIFLTIIYSWNYIMMKLQRLHLQIFTFLNQSSFYFLYWLIWAGFWASNQQMVHGYEVQQHHYHFMTNIPVFIITVTIIGIAFLDKYVAKFKPVILGIVLLLVVWHALGVQVSSYRFWAPMFMYNQSYAKTFNWLEENSNVNDVVYSGRELEELVPIYTHDAVYDALHASVYPVPLDRLEHNYFIGMALAGVTPDQAKAYLYANRDDVGQRIFEGQYWRSVCGSFGCFPDSVLDDLADKYIVFSRKPLIENLKLYRVDYIVWDKEKDSFWQIKKLSNLKAVYSAGPVSIFSLR